MKKQQKCSTRQRVAGYVNAAGTQVQPYLRKRLGAKPAAKAVARSGTVAPPVEQLAEPVFAQMEAPAEQQIELQAGEADSVSVSIVLLAAAVGGMLGSGALAYSTLNVLTEGWGLFAVLGMLCAELVGGHFMVAAKGARQITGTVLVILCMSTEVFLAVDREDLVGRMEAVKAGQQTTASEAMEDCSSKQLAKGLGSPDRLNAEQIRVDKCNARNAERATRADAKADKAASKAADRGWYELAALIGLALLCSLATSLASSALVGLDKALRCRRK
jgi:hypothetical protein